MRPERARASAEFLRLPLVFVGEKTRAEGTIANTARERKSNWQENAVKMLVSRRRCGKRPIFSGFSWCRRPAPRAACYSAYAVARRDRNFNGESRMTGTNSWK